MGKRLLDGLWLCFVGLPIFLFRGRAVAEEWRKYTAR